jgi:hypothetical protein
MAILPQMSPEKPSWLQPTREFCREAGIEIAGWGSDTLIVNAKSSDQARQFATQLRSLGFEPIENEVDTESGLLLLSRDPAATRAKQKAAWASVDITKRPIVERVGALLEVALFLWIIWYGRTTAKFWLYLAGGAIFLWDACRVAGWKLEITRDALRIRRYFVWTGVPWAQVQAVKTQSGGGRGGYQEVVWLKLASKPPLRLGAFNFRFARAMRDRLRNEIAQREFQSN